MQTALKARLAGVTLLGAMCVVALQACGGGGQGIAPQVAAAPPVVPSLHIQFDSASIAAIPGAEVTGSVVLGHPGRPGSTTAAAKFGGMAAPGHVRIPNVPAMQFSGGATYDLWVRLDSGRGMSGWGSAADTGWMMGLLAKSHDRLGVAFSATATDASAPGTGLGYALLHSMDGSLGCAATPVVRNPGRAVGEWFRLTVTLSPESGYKVYNNKVLINDCPQARPDFAAMNTQDLYIGKLSDRWYPLDGAIQDVRIYQTALTPAQVQALP